MERRFICSLGGGGVRSLSQMYLLDLLEQKLGFPLSYVIDIFSGVSGGAIACIPLAFPGKKKLSASQMITLFIENAPFIQRKWQEKGGPLKPWLRRLHNLFFPQFIRLISEAYTPFFDGIGLHELDTEVVMPIFDLLSEQPHVFTRTQARKDHPAHTFWMGDLLEATAAAPGLFPMKPLAGPLGSFLGCDGVFGATHPLWLSFLHGLKLFPETKKWTLIAVGAGDNPLSFHKTPWSRIQESSFVSAHITHHFLGYHQEKIYQNALPDWEIETFFFHPPGLDVIDFRAIHRAPQILALAKQYYQDIAQDKVNALIHHLGHHFHKKG